MCQWSCWSVFSLIWSNRWSSSPAADAQYSITLHLHSCTASGVFTRVIQSIFSSCFISWALTAGSFASNADDDAVRGARQTRVDLPVCWTLCPSLVRALLLFFCCCLCFSLSAALMNLLTPNIRHLPRTGARTHNVTRLRARARGATSVTFGRARCFSEIDVYWYFRYILDYFVCLRIDFWPFVSNTKLCQLSYDVVKKVLLIKWCSFSLKNYK